MLRYLVLALMLLLSPQQSSAQARTDIMTIYGRFLVSRLAMARCGTIEGSVDRKFMVNFTAVTIRAAQVLKARNPTLSDVQLSQKMDAFTAGLRDDVEADITQNGCATPRIQQVLQLYKIHAAMDLGPK